MLPHRPSRKSQSAPKPVDLSPQLLQYATAKWTERLIELVLEQPALYNPKHADYRNIAVRDVIWESIGAALHTNAEDVKKKWRSLRDTFSRITRNRYKKGIPDRGSSKKWTWADKMEPLGMFLTTSGHSDRELDSSSLLEVQIDDDSTSATQDSTQEIKREVADCIQESDYRGHESAAPDDGESSYCLPEINSATSSTGKRLYPHADDNFSHSMGYFDEEKRAKMDPIDLLFLAHASTVKTFSARRQAITKLKIAEVIMQEELNHQEECGSDKDE